MKKISLLVLVIMLLFVTGCGKKEEKKQEINTKTDKKETLKEKMKKIDEEYTTYRSLIDIFNKKRADYYTNVSSDLYEESISNYDVWVEEIDEYTEALKTLDKKSEYLMNNCIDTIYSDKDINTKCEQFMTSYETAFNYYVDDINEFNRKISEYARKLKKTQEYPEYKMIFDYVDLNGDNEFKGKKIGE